MKLDEKHAARKLRESGHSIKEISRELNVAKSSVSIWVRDIRLTNVQQEKLTKNSHTYATVEKRRLARLTNESKKREAIITAAEKTIPKIKHKDLWLMGTMLYWAEGDKTQRMVRFSNGDPEMIKIMMAFFRQVCGVPEDKFRGYIHIHHKLEHTAAEKYWSEITQVPDTQFFKTYRKPNKSSQNKKDSLPNGVLDIYVLDTTLFLKITGWARGIFYSY